MPVGAPVVLVAGEEPPDERRQRDQHQRGAQGEQPRGGDEQPGEGAELGVDAVEGAARLADLGPVVVASRGVERRDDHRQDEHRRRHAEHRDPERVRDRPCRRAARPPRGDERDRGQRQSQVLLHQHQGERPPQGRAGALRQEGLQGEGDQRDGEADLVEVEVDGALDAPGQPVRETERESAATTQEPGGGPRDRHGGEREERGLRDQQRDRRGEEPVQRPEQGGHRAEVVPEDEEPRPLEVGHRRPQLRVGAHDLLEDAQVPGEARHVPVPADGDDRVGGEEGSGQEPVITSRADGVPVTRGEGDRHRYVRSWDLEGAGGHAVP